MEKDTGKKLKELREEHGLSQEKFANEIGVSRQIVSRWEKGKVIPNVGSVKKICDYYRISTSLLLNTNIPVGEEDKSQPVAKKIINKKVLIKGIAIFLLLLIVLYMIYSVYKYFLLKDLEEKFKEYDNWTNYYAEIRTLEEARLTGKTEIWYKDNKYKIIIKSYYDDGNKSEITKWINCNNNKFIEFDTHNNTKIEKNTIIDKEVYSNGNFIKTYLHWLNLIDKSMLIQYVLKPCWINSEQKNNEIAISFDKIRIRFDKNSMMPIAYIDNTNGKIIISYYNIIKNNVSDEDLNTNIDLQ